jgi:hypothetical protein
VCTVAGSPFKFQVYDACRASARGDGLSLVQCNERATFVVTAPDAKYSDIDVRITSELSEELQNYSLIIKYYFLIRKKNYIIVLKKELSLDIT